MLVLTRVETTTKGLKSKQYTIAKHGTLLNKARKTASFLTFENIVKGIDLAKHFHF